MVVKAGKHPFLALRGPPVQTDRHVRDSRGPFQGSFTPEGVRASLACAVGGADEGSACAMEKLGGPWKALLLIQRGQLVVLGRQ